MAQDYDLVIIGSGPGGYTAAVRAGQLGLKTAIVEKEKTLGGTCLNIGCIPSKALLDSSEHYDFMKKHSMDHGVEGDVKLNLPSMMKRKDKIVGELTGGVAYLMKKNKVTVVEGFGKITSPKTVEVVKADGTKESLNTKSVLIATGSTVIELPHLKFDGDKVISSTEALTLNKVPKDFIVVGGGAIGLEMGSVWGRLGANVTVIEAAPKICGPMDGETSKELHKVLVKQGMTILTNSKVIGAEVLKTKVKLTIEGGEVNEVSGDVVLVAVGRKPYTEGLGLKEMNIDMTDRGQVKVNDNFQTSVPNIYAIGDVIDGPMLAHKAEEEGVVAVELIAGHRAQVNYLTNPSVIYTWPEVASVGFTEEELKEKGIPYNKGKFPFTANGRAKAIGETSGFVKFLAHKDTDKILGCHIVGPRASDVLAEAVVAMEFQATSSEVGHSFHGHPTLSEVMREAALAVRNNQRQM